MGNTFGPNGFASGSSLHVESLMRAFIVEAVHELIDLLGDWRQTT
jgi:hypothetical protein